MVDAASEFKKSGFNEEDSATLAGVAAMYQNVADDAISAGESANFIISQMKAFGLEAEDATHIIDALNEVSNTQAVSSADLANNLGKASAAMALGNNTYEQSLAMMTAITEINRSGAKSARALVSVQSRLTQVLDEQSSTGKALIGIYDGLGIALKDQNGQLRPTFEIFKDLAKVWPNLTTNQKDYIALTQAGANQTSNFVALMDNFDAALKAEATAMESSGSAARENAAYMESLEAQTTQLKATFQDFANNVIDKELVSSILTLANDALGVLNTETGKTITQWGLLTGVLTGGIVIYGQIAGKLLSAGSAVVSLTKALSAGVATATMFTKAALPLAAAIGGIVVIGWKAYEWLKDTNPTLEETTERLEDANTQLENNKTRIEEINNLPWNERTSEILSEKDALEKENEELLNQISHYQELRKEKIKAKYESPVAIHGFDTQYRAVSTWGAEQSFVLDPKQVSEYEKMGYTIERVAESAIYAGDALKNKLTENVKTLTGAMANGSIENLEYADIVYDDTVAALTELAETSDDYKALLDQLNGAVEDYSAKEKLRAETIESTDAEFQELVAKTPELTGVTEQLNGAYYTNIEALKQLITTSDEYKNGRITDEYETTVAVIENSKTRLAALKAEMSAIAQYGSTDSLAYQSRKDNIAAMNQAIYTAERKLLGLAGSGLHWTSSATGGSGNGSGSGKTTTKKATDLALEEFKNLQKDLEHQRELGLISEEEYYDKLEQLVKDYKAKATAHMKEYGTDVDTINRNMYQYEEEIYKGRAKLADDLAEQQKKAAEEAAQAQKEAVEKAAQAQKEALEKQKEDFETAVNYVIKQIDEEISKLQDLRDQTEQYYDDKIDAVNKANDALEDQIQHEELLNNLAKAKDKQLYVFQNGQFQYVQDVEAIASAQAELDAYERDKALQKEVENLETLKEQALASIDKQIEGWEKYKEQWESVTTQYQEQQEKLLAEQVLGIDTEQKNWETRLDNVQSFVDKYNSILSNLGAVDSGASSGSGTAVSGDGWHLDYSKGNTQYASAMDDPGVTDEWKQANSKSLSSAIKSAVSTGVKVGSGVAIGAISKGSIASKHASGTLSASGGLSLVGERGPELRVLNSGDGVIPADATRNLWDWASYNPKDFMSGIGSDNIFHIGNIALPNVTDAKSFVNGLKQLAYQRAYKRA